MKSPPKAQEYIASKFTACILLSRDKKGSIHYIRPDFYTHHFASELLYSIVKERYWNLVSIDCTINLKLIVHWQKITIYDIIEWFSCKLIFQNNEYISISSDIRQCYYNFGKEIIFLNCKNKINRLLEI